MSDIEKQCVICGQSCAGQPRIKNEKGQYAHQACVQAKQDQHAEPEPTADHDDLYDDGLGEGMDDLFDDLGDMGEIGIDQADGFGDSAGAGSAMACPSCGQRMPEGAAICMGCGYNTQSGKTISTKRKNDQGSGKANAALGGMAKVGGFAAGPFVPLIGAIVGGIIGAAIWAAISYFTGYEIGWIAWGIGALVGMGASISPLESGGGGAVTGAMAAIVAMASITGGKYAASHFAVQQAFGGTTALEPMTIDDVEEQWLMTRLADDHCKELIDNGGTIDWGGDELYIKAAYWPEDYPQDVVDQTNLAWTRMNKADKTKLRQRIVQDTLAEDPGYDLSIEDVDEEWALSVLVEDICKQRVEDGKAINWPDPNLPMTAASWPDDYPEIIQEQVQTKAEQMSDDDLYAYKQNMVDQANEARAEFNGIAQSVTQSSFIDSLKHPMNILFMFLAVITAYGIAANDD
ncbi:MAG: hypothetical protein ACWA5W_09355 [Phycisphaerales bacterium]